MSIETDILSLCQNLGFAAAGIAPAAPTDYAEELRAWLDDGRHGEMDYLDRTRDVLLDPAGVLPDTRAIICVADRYHDGVDEAPRPPRTGRIARYARGDDYHRVIRKRLHTLCDALRETHPDAHFRACVDTAPLLEREHAARAGLGAIGKHTLLIERGVGSWLLLGSVLTTLPLTPSTPAEPDPCGTCTRCIDACPTDAITPFAVDARRCISYLTIEHRTAIDPSLFAGMGDWIFGCDVCQEVCPHNQPTERTREAPVHDAYAPRRAGFDLLEVLGWSEDDRRAAFVRSAMKRAKLAMMKRNAVIAAGNYLATHEDAELRQRLMAIAGDAGEDEVVRGAAREVLGGAGAS